MGERPTARFKRGYKWTYLIGLCPSEEREELRDNPAHGNTELFSLALGELAKEVGAGDTSASFELRGQSRLHTGGEVHIPNTSSLVKWFAGN